MGVVGTGIMGEHHARFYASQSDIDLAGVTDSDAQRAAEVAFRHHTTAFPTIDALIEAGLDAASICVPTGDHRAVALALLSAGVHVLIEKPLAATFEDAQAIARAAERADRIAAVGHIERFNPVVTELRARLSQAGRIVSLAFTRVSPYPGRIRDTGVTLDLATHDLDLARFILGQEPIAIYAVARSIFGRENGVEDALSAVVTFPESISCTLDVNWISPVKVRSVRVLGELGRFDVDLMRQQLDYYEGTIVPARWRELSELSVGTGEGTMTRYAIEHREPLAIELRGFLDSLTGGGSIVTSYDGAAAVFLAEEALASWREHAVRRVDGAEALRPADP